MTELFIVTNPGFETGDFTGWIENDAKGVISVAGYSPRTGIYSCLMNSYFGGAYGGNIYQDIVGADLEALKGRTIVLHTYHKLAWALGIDPSYVQIILTDGYTSDTTTYQTTIANYVLKQSTITVNPAATYLRMMYLHYHHSSGGVCTWFIDDISLHLIISPATVSTDPATGVGTVLAAINGTLDNDGGEACDCGFEWGETIAYGNTTPTQSRTTGQTFAQTITGLDPNKTYHFRALATNAAGTGYGANRTFTTEAAAPTVDTDSASDIEHIAAALNGELTYDGEEACDCGFEWGLTMAYGNTTPTQSRTTGQTFSQPISGLAPNTPYHFRACATNSSGTSYGPDRSFTTLASAPLATTDPATGLGAVLATINGTLDDDIGEVCQCGFEWGLDTSYGTITATESKVTGETFSQVIGGLMPCTIYHFRAFATNSFGTGHGADMAFTTALVISRSYALARREL
ncbi:hypothetical protein ES703_88775 [subsurface metagenome]